MDKNFSELPGSSISAKIKSLPIEKQSSWKKSEENDVPLDETHVSILAFPTFPQCKAQEKCSGSQNGGATSIDFVGADHNNCKVIAKDFWEEDTKKAGISGTCTSSPTRKSSNKNMF